MKIQQDANTLQNGRESKEARESHAAEGSQRWRQHSPVNLHLLQICLFSVCKRGLLVCICCQIWLKKQKKKSGTIHALLLYPTSITIYSHQYLHTRVHLQNSIYASGPLSRLLKISACRFLYRRPLQRATLNERTGGKKPLPVLHLFYFITSLLGK